MKSIFLLSLSIAFSSPAAFAAGVDTSGGGRGVVCRNPQGQIESAELLDLWEARTIYQRDIPESDAPVREQVEKAFKNLLGVVYFEGAGSDALLPILHKHAFRFLNNETSVVRLNGTKLNDTNDSMEAAVPADCNVEQIVNFMDSPTRPLVLMNQDIVNKLSRTSQAALIVHEALYAFLREYDETNSIRVRRIVGHVFSGANFFKRDSDLGGKHLSCSNRGGGPVSSVSIYEKEGGGLGLIQTNDRGQLSLGLFNAPQTTETFFSQVFENSLDFILSNDSCKNLPKEGSENPYQIFMLPGTGPADFQRQSILTARCENGRAVLEIGGGSRQPVALTCTMM